MNSISHTSEKRAIIDIGSNTVRLVVYNGPARAPVVILNEKVNARLGKDMGKTGAISEKSMRTALSALARFAELLRLMQVDNIECVATAAARDASNGPEFLAEVRSYGLSPRLLSGDEEARTSATGVIAAFPGAKGIAADLGGGSLELVEIDGEVLPGGITLPFGTLRLPDLRAAGPDSFAETVRSALAERGWKRGKDQPLYIVGGSWRALALQAMREIDWPLDDPHDFEISAQEALKLCRKFEKGKLEKADPRITNSRMATLPDAAALLAQLIDETAPSRLIFSSWGLREGLLFQHLPDEMKAQDPMLASVSGFARSAFASPKAAAAVTAWTAQVCEDAPGEGNLRKASTLLALAAMRTEPNMRTEEAMTWALRKRWIGLDKRGRAMMAMTVFANSGLTEIPEQFCKLADRSDLDRGITWGLAVRLCRRLTGCTPLALEHSSLTLEGGRLVLSLDETVQALYSAGIGKDLRALAEWLKLEWSVMVCGRNETQALAAS
ncbi:Ppx/GppA family phosphatase [Novosphingobium sp. PP1Y]|uniref:Ppx/GppA family phosphatase n=1 Tax=Novosphingobium sp. PP1Y TaxID=702113 RepID=UPI00020EE946|nr:Ppx/GppA family phosphatase [Novosphingobium sp. PP1Y]CCA91661.1 exopolyphosphatase [Novosphingobium sp. PP1Y]